MSSAISVTVDDLLCHRKKASPDYKRLIPRLTDSVALIGHVHKELSFKRRDAMRPFLNQEFKQACSRTLKPGKLLFGEYLPKTWQELKTTNKIMHKITPNAKRGSISQKNRYTSQYRGHSKNKSFLRSKGGGGGSPSPQNQSTAQPIPTLEEFYQKLTIIKTKVNLLSEHIDSFIIPYLCAKVTHFQVGQLSLYLCE